MNNAQRKNEISWFNAKKAAHDNVKGTVMVDKVLASSRKGLGFISGECKLVGADTKTVLISKDGFTLRLPINSLHIQNIVVK